jgi:hypothetical protein
MEFRIDYGNINLPQHFAADLMLYASIDGRASSLANGEVVFYDPERGHQHIMTIEVLQAMDACREFRSLEEHIQGVLKALPELKGQAEAVRRVLRGLIDRGLLVSDQEFLARFSQASVQAPDGPVDVYIRACDRPEQLRRLLASLIEYEARFERRLRYVLVDDSVQEESLRRHAELLREFSEASHCTVEHVERERWQRIVTGLCAALPESARALTAMLVRDTGFAGRRGGGIGKNLITLLSAGRRYLLLDDDFVFRMRRHPDFVPGLAFDARANAIRTYADQASALGAGTELEHDPVADHLDACGSTLAQLARRRGCELGREQLRGLAPGRHSALRPDARAALTVNGHRGASGAGGLAWLYLLDAPGRAGLLRDRDTYLTSLGDPQVWFGTRAHLVSQPGNFTPFAVDNRQLRPCTSPFGRSEDALFGALVHWSDPGAFELSLPYSIGHLQEARRDRGSALNHPETPDINVCLAELARDAQGDLYAQAAPQRLAMYAARLEDLSAASDRDIAAYLAEFLAYRRSALVEQLQAAAERSSDAPLYWGADLRQVVEANGKALIEPGAPRFAGWAEDADTATCASQFRHEAETLARGLRAWPAAWEAASGLGQSWQER